MKFTCKCGMSSAEMGESGGCFFCPVCQREYKTYIKDKCLAIRDITDLYPDELKYDNLITMDEVK